MFDVLFVLLVALSCCEFISGLNIGERIAVSSQTLHENWKTPWLEFSIDQLYHLNHWNRPVYFIQRKI